MNNNIEKLLVKPDDAIKAVMELIDDAPLFGLPNGIVIVVNDKRELMGVVTDGDVRRAIIKGISIDQKVSEIMVTEPVAVPVTMSPNSMLREIKRQVNIAVSKKRLREGKIDQIILIDENNKIVGISSFFNIWKKSDAQFKNICIIGLGFVGLTLAVALADIGFKVLGIDKDKKNLEMLANGEPHFHEKNLEYLLKRNINKTLFVNENITNDDNDIYIICVGTPVGENHKADLNFIKKACYEVGSILKDGDLVIVRSTVPVGTCRNVVLPILEKESNLICGKNFYLAFAPERTVEGKALEELKTLPQIIGGFNKTCLDVSSNFFRYLAPNIIVVDSLEDAEMAKLLNNSFRDVSFAFANELIYICEEFNINATKIIKAATEGYPRNKIPLPGFVGGYCLKKDPYIYAISAQKDNIKSELTLKSREINESLPNYAFEKIKNFIELYNKNKDNSKIFIIGFAYKGIPETSDMRYSSTLDLLDLLKKKKWKRIYGYDPVLYGEEIEKLGIQYCSIEKGFENADIVIIMNNNPKYEQLDIITLLEKTNKKCLFFDGWSIFEPKEILKVRGIVYQSLGFREESN